MRSRRRAILVIAFGDQDPKLPEGLAIIDRRTSIRSASRPGEVAGGCVEELLVAGDALPDVPEMCELPHLSLAEVEQYAMAHASIEADL